MMGLVSYLLFMLTIRDYDSATPQICGYWTCPVFV